MVEGVGHIRIAPGRPTSGVRLEWQGGIPRKGGLEAKIPAMRFVSALTVSLPVLNYAAHAVSGSTGADCVSRLCSNLMQTHARSCSIELEFQSNR
jgi:hypothetical protein